MICNKEDLKNYLLKMEQENGFLIHGFGGTDFRPVFTYVQELQEKGKLKDLQGLLYFTDGDGIFPDKAPGYHTAFFFTETADASIKVPAWSIKVLLDEKSIDYT